MAVVIPTDTAIIIMIAISCVYSTLTIVLAICTCCHCYHKKKSKSRDRDTAPVRSAAPEAPVQIEGPSMSWGSGLDYTDSEACGERREVQTNHSRIGVSEGGSPQGSAGGSIGLTCGSRHKGASPHLLKHLVLPPIGHTPSPVLSGPTDYKMKTYHSHDGKKVDRNPGEAPAPSNASVSQGFRVLTVHKSTLKRRKKVEPCPNVDRRNGKGGKVEAPVNSESTGRLPPLVPPKPKKRPQKRPKVARTDSTKPLMDEDVESPTELIAENAMWSQQEVLLEEQCVLQNPSTVEEDTGTKSLDTLQGDIMEMITAL